MEKILLDLTKSNLYMAKGTSLEMEHWLADKSQKKQTKVVTKKQVQKKKDQLNEKIDIEFFFIPKLVPQLILNVSVDLII